MEVKQTRMKFQIYGKLAGLSRIDHGYGVRAGKTKNGNALKQAKFDVLVPNGNGQEDKFNLQITGYEREQVAYWDTELKQVGRVPWEERFGLPNNQRLFPIPYDAATDMEMASDGDFYYLGGELQGNSFEDRNGVQRNFIEFACDTARELFGGNNELKTIMKGDFVFNYAEPERKTIHGFLINYKGETTPITFAWGGSDEALEMVSKKVKFGTICHVVNGYIGKDYIEVKSDTSPKVTCDFGSLGEIEPTTTTRAVTKFVVVGMDVEKEQSPYSEQDLGLVKQEAEEDELTDDDLF